MEEMSPEIMQRIRFALANQMETSEGELFELLGILFRDYENLLDLGKSQVEKDSCPSPERKPNPLELEISVSFRRIKNGYLSTCGQFELDRFGKKWTLKETSKGTEYSYLSKKEAVNKVLLYHCSSILDQMWDQGFEVKNEGLSKEEACAALVSRANHSIMERNLRVQEESLERVANYIARLFC